MRSEELKEVIDQSEWNQVPNSNIQYDSTV